MRVNYNNRKLVDLVGCRKILDMNLLKSRIVVNTEYLENAIVIFSMVQMMEA